MPPMSESYHSTTTTTTTPPTPSIIVVDVVGAGPNDCDCDCDCDCDGDGGGVGGGSRRPLPSSSSSDDYGDSPPALRRGRSRSRATRSTSTRSAAVIVAVSLAPLLLLFLLLDGGSFFHHVVVNAREIVATHEWQLLDENDTLPAGLHVRMDLTTGEKWAKLPSNDDDDEEDIRATVHGSDEEAEDAVAVEVDPGSGALTIVETTGGQEAKEQDQEEATTGGDAAATQYKKDYGMMHRVISSLPPEELERFGGLPALPSPGLDNNHTTAKLSEEQREAFERRMEEIWATRQEELARAQESVADLPSMLRDRIGTMREYLEDPEAGLRSILEERRRRAAAVADEEAEDDDDGPVHANDVVAALRDLEFQLADVDMARDFHTLGGWPILAALLDEEAEIIGGGDDHHDEDDEEEGGALLALADEVRALAAMTIGTAVSNLEEFQGWALEDVSGGMDGGQQRPRSVLSLLVDSFAGELSKRSERMGEGNTMAVVGSSTPSAEGLKSRATYRLRAVYALGSMMRGNAAAQQHFVAYGGAEYLIRDVLGTLSSVRGPAEDKKLAKLDYKFASKVLALGEDVVTDVVLHVEDYPQKDADSSGEMIMTANRLVAAFTTEEWCDLSLRMLSPPLDLLGENVGRGIKERALGAVRAMAPGCVETARRSDGEDYNDGDTDAVMAWGVEEVRRVRSEWNREGSDDGLDPTYRRELLELADGVLEALR